MRFDDEVDNWFKANKLHWSTEYKEEVVTSPDGSVFRKPYIKTVIYDFEKGVLESWNSHREPSQIEKKERAMKYSIEKKRSDKLNELGI
jgi:hypothetical protein